MLIEHYIPERLRPHTIYEHITKRAVREWYISSRKLGCLIHHHYIGLFEAWFLSPCVHGIETVDIICLSILDEKSRTRSSTVVQEVMLLEILRQANTQAALYT